MFSGTVRVMSVLAVASLVAFETATFLKLAAPQAFTTPISCECCSFGETVNWMHGLVSTALRDVAASRLIMGITDFMLFDVLFGMRGMVG